MNGILEQAKNLYSLTECVLVPVERHEDGRNQLFIVRRNGENQYVLRVSALGDRTEEIILQKRRLSVTLHKTVLPWRM